MDAASLKAFDGLSAKAGESLWPGSIAYAGEDYPCEVVREPVLIGEIVDGGETEEGDLVVRIRKAVLEDKPEREAVVTFKAKRFRIREVKGDEVASACWLIECERDA
jgi:hypothetical protein